MLRVGVSNQCYWVIACLHSPVLERVVVDSDSGQRGVCIDSLLSCRMVWRGEVIFPPQIGVDVMYSAVERDDHAPRQFNRLVGRGLLTARIEIGPQEERGKALVSSGIGQVIMCPLVHA